MNSNKPFDNERHKSKREELESLELWEKCILLEQKIYRERTFGIAFISGTISILVYDQLSQQIDWVGVVFISVLIGTMFSYLFANFKDKQLLRIERERKTLLPTDISKRKPLSVKSILGKIQYRDAATIKKDTIDD